MKTRFVFFAMFLVLGNILKAQWQTIHYASPTNTIPNLNAVYFTSSQSGLAAGNGSMNPIIIRSNTGGLTWDTVFTSSINGTFKDITFSNTNTAITVGDYYPTKGIIARTANYGATWDTIIVNKNLSAIHFPSLQTGYIVGSGGCILKTINSGISWFTIPSPITDNFNSVKFINDSVGFICGGTKIIKTQDGGVSWTITNIGQNVYAINFPSANMGYCYNTLFDTTHLFKTFDSGATWSLHSSSYFPFNYNTSMYFVNDTVGYICGVFKIEKTTDGGLTWQSQYSSAPSSGIFHDWVADMHFINKDTGFAVGGGGYGQFYRTHTGGDSVLSSIVQNAQYNTFINFSPNPFSDYSIFSFSNVTNTNLFTLDIYNVLGDKIKTYEITNEKTLIQREDLKTGIYLYKCYTSQKTFASGKLIITK